MWTIRACAAKTPSNAGKTSGKTYVPQIRTTSAAVVTGWLSLANMCPSSPRRCVCAALRLTSDESAPQTGAPQISATRASSGWPPENATPSPTIMIGCWAVARIRAAWVTSDGSGAVRVARIGVPEPPPPCSGHRVRPLAGPGRLGPWAAASSDLDCPAQHPQQRRLVARPAGPTWSGRAMLTKSAAICASIAS